MNTKKIGTTLGIGVMLVAILSMLAIPASALSSTSTSRGYDCGHGYFYAYAVGYYDSSDPSVFVYGSAYPSSAGYSLDSSDPLIASSIVYADYMGTCNICGLHVRATAWVSPITYPYTSGGSVETW